MLNAKMSQWSPGWTLSSSHSSSFFHVLLPWLFKQSSFTELYFWHFPWFCLQPDRVRQGKSGKWSLEMTTLPIIFMCSFWTGIMCKIILHIALLMLSHPRTQSEKYTHFPDHRITESLRLEKISTIIKSNLQPTKPYPKLPHPVLFEHFQGCDSTTTLGSPFQCLITPSVKEFLLISNPNLSWCPHLSFPSSSQLTPPLSRIPLMGWDVLAGTQKIIKGKWKANSSCTIILRSLSCSDEQIFTFLKQLFLRLRFRPRAAW